MIREMLSGGTRRIPFRPAGLLAGALLVFAVAGVPLSAADGDASVPVRTVAEKSDERMDALLDPVMAEAVGLFKKEKFSEALAKCDEADRIFKKEQYEPTPHVTAQKSMVSQLRSDIRAVWGHRLMAPLQASYAEAEKLGGSNPKKAGTILKNVIRSAGENAKLVPEVKPEADLLVQASEKLLASPTFFIDDAKAEQERERRGKLIASEVDPILRDAEMLLGRKLFKQAMARTVEASEKLGKLGLGDSPAVLAKKSAIVRLRTDIAQQWERAYVMLSRQKYLAAVESSGKDMQKALELATAALNTAREGRSEVPYSSDELQEIESACQKLIQSENFQEATSLATIDTELSARRERIDALYAEGQAYYRARMFSKARDSLEQLYILDPFNEKANVLLGKIYRKVNDTAWMRRENEVLERLNEIEWKWNNSSRPTGNVIVDDRAPQESQISGKARVYDKLQSIIIPEVDFDGMSVSQVVTQVKRRSKECDLEDKSGINIFYEPQEEDREITLNMSNVPVGELIRYICLYAGLKYSVDASGVRIGSSNLDDMDTRYFSMSGSLYKGIVSGGTAGTESTGKEEKKSILSDDELENPFKDMGKEEEKKSDSKEPAGNTAEVLKDFFIACGIPFGEGASVSYDEPSRKLSVRNTPENLKLMDVLLREIDVMTPMVLIEAKIIEISVMDLEELGFDWTLSHNNQSSHWLYGNSSSSAGFGSADSYAIGEAVINQIPVRHAGGASSSSSFNTDDVSNALNLVSDMNIVPNFGPDGAYNIFLTVHAVDQSQRGEVLSAPKVIAFSGSQATIEMAQEMYFPDSWNDPEVTTSNNTYEYTPPYPDFGDAEKIGTTFTVEPNVSPNLHTITVKIHPTIKNLTGWTDYDYQIIIGGISSVDENATEWAPKMKMPEISKREIDTQLKVYDGETVVLGGILKDETLKRDDKYPFLGEVPLFGNLFASKAERSTKTNLLIFITPRMMGLDGVPIKSRSDNGTFDFSR